jgi:hypothetical protein
MGADMNPVLSYRDHSHTQTCDKRIIYVRHIFGTKCQEKTSPLP